MSPLIDTHRFVRIVAAALACGAALTATAQALPSVPPKDGKAAASVRSTDPVDDIRSALAEANKNLERIEAAGEAPLDAPPGTPLHEILQRLTLARMLAGTYEKQLNALERTRVARQHEAEAKRDNESWRGYETPAPYSVLMADQLRDDLEAARTKLASAQGTAALLQRLESEYGSKMQASQAAARLAAEAADRARGTPEFPKREWERSLAALRAAVDSAVEDLLQTGRRGVNAEIAAASAAAELAGRKLGAVGENVALPREDLDRVLAEIDARRRTAQRDLDLAARASSAASEELSKAELRLAAGGAALAERAGPAARDPERDIAAAREAANTASQRVFLLREYLLQLDSEKAAWEARASALNMDDPVRSRAAYDRLTESLAGLRATRQYLEQQLSLTESRLRDEEARQRSASHVETPASRLLLAALRDRQADLRKALDSAAPLQRLVSHFRADFEGRRRASLAERAKDRVATAWLAARDVWNLELFAIDDTFETADGRKIAVSRSVTVGKTFGAVLIVLVGYWVASFVLRWLERRAIAHRRATAQGARLVRKWLQFVVAAILGLVALLIANIPLTAFAFLGGALAIAAGFGLQTLLKNLVSGVMLLIERPLRLGDLVEVDGIRGRVAEIGIRASMIRSADGIESMIPNSRFLEGNMTNWTYSSPQARQTIAIGVAYGSPLRKVVEVLGEVLGRHGLVLKDPAPQVYLDEYAEKSINFSITYWVEMTESGDARRVKSDLLLMIDRAFTEAGIAIPFPPGAAHVAKQESPPTRVVDPAGVRPAG